MTQIFYKVVQRNTLASYNVGHNPYYIESGLSIRYSIGDWTYPKVKRTKLFVFKDLQAARNLVGRDKSYYSIYSCEVKNPKDYGPVNINNTEVLLEAIKNKKKYKHLINMKSVPDGTIFCDAVKLIEEIK